jgi:hypothetical protein
MHRLEQTRVPKSWLTQRVGIELHVFSANSEDYQREYGVLADLNDVGAVLEQTSTDSGQPRTVSTFYPWTSIKGITLEG